MYTYTMRVCTSNQYHAKPLVPGQSKFYTSPEYLYEFVTYREIPELAAPSYSGWGAYIYMVQLTYFTDSKNERQYLKLNRKTNPLKQTGKLARFRIRSIEKKYYMESKGYVVGNERAKR